MIDRGEGRIVNVSSVAATLSSPGEAAYDASKSALSVFSEAMAIDIWDTGVKVLVVYPGVVDTPLFQMPDNDPFTAPVEFITVDDLVAATFAALDRGALEVYIPEYFKTSSPERPTTSRASSRDPRSTCASSRRRAAE